MSASSWKTSTASARPFTCTTPRCVTVAPASARIDRNFADRGETLDARRACRLCPLDTIVTGLAVATLDLATLGSAPTIVAGTEFASGVSPGDNPDLIHPGLELKIPN